MNQRLRGVNGSMFIQIRGTEGKERRVFFLKKRNKGGKKKPNCTTYLMLIKRFVRLALFLQDFPTSPHGSFSILYRCLVDVLRSPPSLSLVFRPIS